MIEEEINPYAPPQAEGLVAWPEAESIRRDHLRAESNIKGLGMVSICGAFLGCVAVVAQVLSWEKEFGVFSMAMLVRGLWVPLAWLICGVGLWRVKRWAWSGSILFHVFLSLWNLVHIPLGLIGLGVDVVILRTLLLPRTRRVMANDYDGIMMLTPVIRAPVPAWARWVGGLLTLAGLLTPLFGR